MPNFCDICGDEVSQGESECSYGHSQIHDDTHDHALVAEAYEVAADIVLAVCLEKGSLEHVTGINAEGEYSETVAREHRKYLSGIRRAGLAARSATRALTPADAIAAREARDTEVWNAATRGALDIIGMYDENRDYASCCAVTAINEAVTALIEKDKTNDG